MLKSVSGALTAVLLGVAFYWTVRLAAADRYSRDGSPDGLAAAARLAPGNVEYPLRAVMGELPDETVASEMLERALRASPLDAGIWTEMGFRAERNDPARAEKCLLRAAELDRRFKPKWNLASFYFRRGEEAKFWTWAREALAIAPDNQDAVFQLCWKMSDDADLIFRSAIPPQAGVLLHYLTFLMLTGRTDAAAPVADKLLPVAGQTDVPILLDYCDQEIGAARLERGAKIWNELCRRGLIAAEPASRPDGRLVSNGQFRLQPLNRGFDWRMSAIEGVTQRRDEFGSGMRIEFSGREPESCYPLAQLLLLQPGTHYRLAYTYQMDGIQPGSGLKWQLFVNALGGRQILPETPEHFPDIRAGRSEIAFDVPPEFNSGRLALMYRRASGTSRIEGWLKVSDISLRITK